jgi:hypothetical protein
MSDVSVLSNQYHRLVDTSDKINNSVITIKKDTLLATNDWQEKYPRLSVSDRERSEAKEVLMAFLKNIVELVNEQVHRSDFIPSLVLEEYKKRLLMVHDLRSEIHELINLIEKGQSIPAENMAILDDLMAVLDSERGILFRKMRKSRG